MEPNVAGNRMSKEFLADDEEFEEFEEDDRTGKASSRNRNNPRNRGKKNGGKGPRRRKNARPLKRSKKSRRAKWYDSPFLTTALIAMIALICVNISGRISSMKSFREMKSVVCTDTFYGGTIVDDVDVSGMTIDEAVEYWGNSIEPAYSQATIKLDNGIEWIAEDLGYSSDYVNTLYSAWNGGRNGSIEDRYQAVRGLQEEPHSYSVHRTFYNDDVIRRSVESIAKTIDREPKNASLLSFNTDTYSFEYEDEIIGLVLDQEKLVSDIETALTTGGGSVALKIDEIVPEITKENVSANYGMISYAVTNADSSTANRLSNISLALSIINGTAIEPGETFSFNKVVGERTSARGFKKAPAYSSGMVVEELGGGICQVSTTVFNAAIKANLKIKERHPHSMTVSYVDPGKDAAVNWGDKDLKFTNTSDERVYICCYLTNDKRVRVGVFGKLLPDGMSIIVEGKKTKSLDYSTDYQVNFEMASGEKKVVQQGKKGAKATTYKVYLDANGNEINREELFHSTYEPQKEIVAYGQ